MKVIILQGSPKKKGNTAQVLAWVDEELTALGHESETVYLNGKNINGCLACAKCKQVTDEPGCIQKDDGPEVLEKMVAADLVLFAGPVYFWGVTAQLKTIIDRTYSLYTAYHQPDHASLLERKRQAMLATGGGNYENNAEPVFTAFGRLQKPHKTVNAGELFIGGCSSPQELGEETREKARAFARKIVS